MLIAGLGAISTAPLLVGAGEVVSIYDAGIALGFIGGTVIAGGIGSGTIRYGTEIDCEEEQKECTKGCKKVGEK